MSARSRFLQTVKLRIYQNQNILISAGGAVTQPRADPGVEIGGGHMASAEREPIMGVWGCAPSGVQGQSPWSGGQGATAKPPEAERFLVLSYV